MTELKADDVRTISEYVNSLWCELTKDLPEYRVEQHIVRTILTSAWQGHFSARIQWIHLMALKTSALSSDDKVGIMNRYRDYGYKVEEITCSNHGNFPGFEVMWGV